MIKSISNVFLCSLYFSRLLPTRFQSEQLDFEGTVSIVSQVSWEVLFKDSHSAYWFHLLPIYGISAKYLCSLLAHFLDHIPISLLIDKY